VRVVLVRASDVPTYVQYGGADLGITGSDTLLEHGNQGLYQPLDLRIAACRISVAVRADFDYASRRAQGSRLRVATKYVAIARDFFAAKGVHVDLIKLYGSMELAPLTGLADAIVDLVSTGNTLKANHLDRSRTHHGHQLPARREPGRAQAQARADPRVDRLVRVSRFLPPNPQSPDMNSKQPLRLSPRFSQLRRRIQGAPALVRRCGRSDREGGGRHPG
jgi:ATP phosphoribosyltransferase